MGQNFSAQGYFVSTIRRDKEVLREHAYLHNNENRKVVQLFDQCKEFSSLRRVNLESAVGRVPRVQAIDSNSLMTKCVVTLTVMSIFFIRLKRIKDLCYWCAFNGRF